MPRVVQLPPEVVQLAKLWPSLPEAARRYIVDLAEREAKAHAQASGS